MPVFRAIAYFFVPPANLLRLETSVMYAARLMQVKPESSHIPTENYIREQCNAEMLDRHGGHADARG